MIDYADTAFLVSVHSRDAKSPEALVRMNAQSIPLVWTWLHELEFRNAIRLRAFRKEIDLRDIDAVLRGQSDDMNAGVYINAAPSPAAVARETERLGASHTTTLGTRSLDTLHVAQALVLGVREFLTFDTRQIALAKAAGLKVPKL
jgi:predicted nucleic acid-binding protein